MNRELRNNLFGRAAYGPFVSRNQGFDPTDDPSPFGTVVDKLAQVRQYIEATNRLT